MKTNKVLMWIITLLLLFVDWATFHDFLEPHTPRDWLTLLASILVIFYFAKEYFKKS